MKYVQTIEENRFSNFVAPDDVEGFQHLVNWLRTFRESDIPAAIGKTVDGFAVYRTGMRPIYDVDE